VEYDNGTNGGYWCSQVAAGKLNGLQVRIYGTEGSIEWEQHFPDYVKFTPRNQATQTLSRGTGYLEEKAASGSRLPCGHPEGLYIGFANIYRNVISAILKLKAGETPTAEDLDFPSAKDGLEGVKFVHAVIKSAAEGAKWVSIS
jgi:predicted dehydrogenase